MKQVNIHEFRTHLSHYIKNLEKGETVIVCKHNVPLAELRPIPRRRAVRRPIGLDQGKVTIPPEFYEPLPPDLLEAFGEERARRT